MKKVLSIFGALALLVAPLIVEAADDTLKRDRFGNPVSGGTNASDEIRVFKVNDDGSLDVTVIGGTGPVSVDQGASGLDTDPWNIVLRNSSGAEIGIAGEPLRTRLTDGSGLDIGETSTRPLLVGGLNTTLGRQAFEVTTSGTLGLLEGSGFGDAIPNGTVGFMYHPPSNTAKILGIANWGFNGTDWDRVRLNASGNTVIEKASVVSTEIELLDNVSTTTDGTWFDTRDQSSLICEFGGTTGGNIVTVYQRVIGATIPANSSHVGITTDVSTETLLNFDDAPDFIKARFTTISSGAVTVHCTGRP